MPCHSRPRPAGPSPPRQRPPPPKGSDDPPPAPAEPHTYDPITGRRITVAEYEVKMAEHARKKRQEAVGNLKLPTDLGGDGDGDGGAPGPQQPPAAAGAAAGPPPVPTKPLWPGKSTAQSVDKYVGPPALPPASPSLL